MLHDVINFGVKKAMALDKDILRTVKVSQDESIIPFVSTFNPKDPEIFPVIINNLPILEKDEENERHFFEIQVYKE